MRALVTAFLLASVVSGAQTQDLTTVAAKSAGNFAGCAAESSSTHRAREDD